MFALGAQLFHETLHWRNLGINLDGTNATLFDKIVTHTATSDEDDRDEKEERDCIDGYSRFDPS